MRLVMVDVNASLTVSHTSKHGGEKIGLGTTRIPGYLRPK